MGKTYGLCRVSTKGQESKGNGLEVQEKEILEKYDAAIIIKESYTGCTTVRPVFTDLVNIIKSGDTLVVTKLDRLARNTIEGIQIIQELFGKGVAVHVLNIGLLENTSMGKFFLTTLLAVAEVERNTIIERTQSGKAVARTKAGFKEGRPKKFTDTQLKYALELLKEHSYNEVEEMTR